MALGMNAACRRRQRRGKAQGAASHGHVVEARDHVFEKASAVISSLEAKGGDPADVEAMRGYLSAVVAAGRSQLTLEEFADGFLAWLVSPEGGVAIGFRIAVIVAAFFGLLIVARIVRAWVRRAVDRTPQLSNLLSGFLVMVVYWLTIAFGLMIVLAALGVNVTPSSGRRRCWNRWSPATRWCWRSRRRTSSSASWRTARSSSSCVPGPRPPMTGRPTGTSIVP